MAPTEGPWPLDSGLWGVGNEVCLLSFPGGSFGLVSDFSLILFVSLGLKGPPSTPAAPSTP